MESFLQYHGSVFWVGNIQDGGGDPWHNLLFSKGLTDDLRNTSPLSSVFSSSTTWVGICGGQFQIIQFLETRREAEKERGGRSCQAVDGRADRWMDDTAACRPLLHPGFRVRPHTSRQKWARRQRRILRKQEQQGFRMSSTWCAIGCDGR